MIVQDLYKTEIVLNKTQEMLIFTPTVAAEENCQRVVFFFLSLGVFFTYKIIHLSNVCIKK